MTEVVLTRPTISALIIARDEEAMLANCLDTLKWCDEIIVVDNLSKDATRGIAEREGARVIASEGSFATLRNEALQHSKSDWLFYVDADERVTPALADEVQLTVETATHQAYAVSRNNVLYGSHLEHGGWGQDPVVRLFKRTALKRWSGDVHEHAEIDGSTGSLKERLVHFTHRDVISGLLKTAEWTPIEAQLLVDAEHTPTVTVGLIWRKTIMELVRRVLQKKAYKDGAAGWIEAMIQAMNRMLVYIQVWEKQQKPSLKDRYQQYEKSIVKLWQQRS